MRTFELIFILFSFTSLFILIFNKTYKKKNIFTFLMITSLAFHILLEGVRYELIMFLSGYFLMMIPLKNFRKIKLSLSIMLILSSVLLFLAFPVYTMPTPTGLYDIGTKTYEVSDPSRSEIYGSHSSTRMFNFQIWYPGILKEDSVRAPWLIDQEVTSQALSRDFGFPGFLLNQTQFVSSHSYFNLDIEDLKTYPVVIMSHGWSGSKYLHSDLGESLASQGFIAVSIEHTYGAVATVIGDTVIFKQEDALTGFDDEALGLKSNTRLMMTYGLDISSTIDYLTLLNDDTTDIFHSHIRLDDIGVIGHSTGGGGAIYAALHDTRIKALIGLDAWVEPISDILETKQLAIPSLFLRSESWEVGPNNVVLLPMLERSLSNTSLYQIRGTSHYDFAMVYMYTSLSKVLGFSGSIDTKDITRIVFSANHSFFNQYLNDGLLDTSWQEDDFVQSIRYTN